MLHRGMLVVSLSWLNSLNCSVAFSASPLSSVMSVGLASMKDRAVRSMGCTAPSHLQAAPSCIPPIQTSVEMASVKCGITD